MRTLRLVPGQRVDLGRTPTRSEGDSDDAKQELAGLRDRMEELQHRLHAQKQRSLLILLQGMDAAGKDSTIRRVLSHLHYEGLQAHSFREPTDDEAAHDFLWRYHARLPARGVIGVFNRSWYEGVLIERVDRLVAPAVWRARYGRINAFERHLTAGGTRLLKVFLHLSKDEQLERLRKRRDDRSWKHNPHDMHKRRQWASYQKAYQDALAECTTAWAPWHVVPADRKPGRDVIVARLVVDALEELVEKRGKARRSRSTGAPDAQRLRNRN